MRTSTKVKATPLGRKLWFCTVFFGLIGQVAWIVENMYFATFAQNIFDKPAFGNEYYLATTLMVVFSAVTATVSTIFAGGLCDKTGRRKPFISYGYLIWGATIMLFAVIPVDFSPEKSALIISLLVIFDCIMTLVGSAANDAAFNTWVTDVTDVSNRGKVNSILSMMPVIATVVVLGIAMFTFDKQNYKAFFFALGVIPIVAGVVSILTLKDSPGIVRNADKSYLKETFYGFRIGVIKQNKMMYVCLFALCVVGISQQVFFSYMINFVQKTLGITDYLIPLAVIIVGSAIVTGSIGFLFDRFGRKNFYFPILGFVIFGTLMIYLMKFMPSSVYLPVIFVLGIIMLGAYLSMLGALMSSFQDYIPKGYEGRFQGVRMCFTVLLPMVIGPVISLAIGINSFDVKDAVATTQPPFELFLAASVIAIFALIPLFFVRKDSDRLRKVLLETRDEAAKAAEEISNDVAPINDVENKDNNKS